MYSKIFSVTDASAYFKHLLSRKHNRPTSFSINLPTTPHPRRDSDMKKMHSLRLTDYVHAQSTVYRVHLHFLICNSHNPLFELVKPHEILVFNSITSPNTVVQCGVSRPLVYGLHVYEQCLSGPWSLKPNFIPQLDNVERWKAMDRNAFTP